MSPSLRKTRWQGIRHRDSCWPRRLRRPLERARPADASRDLGVADGWSREECRATPAIPASGNPCPGHQARTCAPIGLLDKAGHERKLDQKIPSPSTSSSCGKRCRNASNREERASPRKIAQIPVELAAASARPRDVSVNPKTMLRRSIPDSRAPLRHFPALPMVAC